MGTSMNITMGLNLYRYLRDEVGKGNRSAWVRDACEQKKLREEFKKR